MDNKEIKINYINLNNDIKRLKRLAKELEKYKSCESNFVKSQGSSKEALEKELKSLYIAGKTLQDSIEQLVEELEHVAKTFKETDEGLSKSFRIFA